MVIPDMGPGQPITDLNPATALSELKRLLDPDAQAQARPDPMAEKLQAVAARGRIGAVVMRLDIAPDLSGVTIETTFWVRVPTGRWVAYGSRTTDRPGRRPHTRRGPRPRGGPPGQGGLQDGRGPRPRLDPGRVQAAEPPHRRRDPEGPRHRPSDAFNRDLDAQMLPVLERPADDARRGHQAGAAPAAGRGTRRRPAARPPPIHARPAGSLSPDSSDPGGRCTAPADRAAGRRGHPSASRRPGTHRRGPDARQAAPESPLPARSPRSRRADNTGPSRPRRSGPAPDGATITSVEPAGRAARVGREPAPVGLELRVVDLRPELRHRQDRQPDRQGIAKHGRQSGQSQGDQDQVRRGHVHRVSLRAEDRLRQPRVDDTTPTAARSARAAGRPAPAIA